MVVMVAVFSALALLDKVLVQLSVLWLEVLGVVLVLLWLVGIQHWNMQRKVLMVSLMVL
ncbi:hypothetical protein SME36J_46680 [Serratia marcescens]|nr:hypothetical protein SME36J_46680 [Serratia marcescens]